jgi:N utilization substance protein A
VAREAGSRSKVAIWTDAENVDPIGSCVGQRGSRIQTIISELGGERIDMVKYDEDPAKFVSNALSPAKVINVDLNVKEKRALVKVLPEQLSLAIGKKGQNVRLAARLTGWKIDIMDNSVDTSAKVLSEEIASAEVKAVKSEEAVVVPTEAEEVKKEVKEKKPKKEKKEKVKKEKKAKKEKKETEEKEEQEVMIS